MSTRLVATVMARTPDAAARWLSEPPEGASFLELRLDALQDPTVSSVEALLKLPRAIPVMATCRGGKVFAGSDEDRITLLSAAGQAGAELIDIDDMLLETFPEDVPGERVASCHLSRFLPRLEALALRIAGHGAHFSKLAVPADTPLQLAELLDLQDRMPDGFAVVITGRLAEAGRIMAAARGAALSYASVDPDDPGHPDQPDIHRLHDILAIETVSPSTRFFAIVGHPVAHSMSPAYHTTVFRQTGIDARMVMLDTDGLSDLMAMSDALNLDGFAVTHPFKQDALGHAASALPGAQATGAANTLLRTPAGWQARNTDWKAACDLLPRILRGWRKKHEGAPRALLLGSGGAARAIAIALADTDADVSVWSRNHDHARALAKDLETVALSNLDGLTADLIINATPVGMAGVDGSALPLSEQNFAPEALALDLAYGGDDSPFRQAAQAAGAQLTTGEDFFAIQARRQAELFCGTPIAADVHKEASRRCGAGG